MKGTRLVNGVIGGSYEADERIAGNAVSLNLYAESVEEADGGAYFTTALRSVPGERPVLSGMEVSDRNGQGCRGLFAASDDTLFAAYGEEILRIRKNPVDGSYSYERIYAQQEGTVGRVSFCETGGVNSFVCWIDGTEVVKAYPLEPDKMPGTKAFPLEYRTPSRVYLTADEVKLDTNFHVVPASICSVAGCLCINDPENDTWYYTDAYILGGTNTTRTVYRLENGNVRYKDGSTYELDTEEKDLGEEEPESQTAYLWLDRYSKPRWQTAESSADNVVALATCGDFLMAFGTRSLQIYAQTTSTDAYGFTSMEFSSAGRNVRELGTKSPMTVAEVCGKVVFLGSATRGERSVWYSDGGVPVRISTNAIERELSGVDTSDAYAFGYMDNGHQFYCLTVRALRKTYCYDFATRQWHDRGTRNPDGRDAEWWACFAACAGGDIQLAGEGFGVLAVLDRKKFDDFRGEPIVKRRTAPVVTNDFSPFMVNDIQLVWNTGTTTDTDNSTGARDPVVMLEVSTDGGNTFGNERWAGGGRTGQYGHRSVWYGIGVGTMFAFRFTVTDRVNVVITGAKISFTPLSHF